MSQVTPLPAVLIPAAMPVVTPDQIGVAMPLAPVDVYLGPTEGGEGSEPEEAVEPQALHRALGIDPSKYAGRTLRMTRAYRRVLERGVTNWWDLRVANRLAMEESPDDSGRLFAETRRIPHRLEVVDVADPQEIHTFGAMHPSMPRSADPRKGEAKKITLAVGRLLKAQNWQEAVDLREAVQQIERPQKKGTGEKFGASVLTIDHERTHATPPGGRHPVYEVSYMDIPEDGTLDEIYRAIHFNLTQDEVPAMMAMMRRAEIHRLRTGVDIMKMKAQKPFRRMLPALKVALVHGGKEGMRKAIADSHAYLQYKLAAFQVAVMWKFGMREFPDIEKLFDEMGVVRVGGRIAVNPSKSRNFYNEKFIPLLTRHGIDAMFRFMALGRRDRERLNRLKGFFTNGFEPSHLEDFLRDEFDQIVPIFGRVMGDPIPQDVDETAVDISPLPILERPKRTGQKLALPSTDEAALSETEIAGRFAELLWNTHRDSPSVLSEHAIPYITFAERSEPQTAARLYSLLIHLAGEKKLNVGDSWELAYSLRRFGYEEEGARLVEFVLRRLDKREWGIFDIAEPALSIKDGRIGELTQLLDIVKRRLDSDFTEEKGVRPGVSAEVVALLDADRMRESRLDGASAEDLVAAIAGDERRPTTRPGIFAHCLQRVVQYMHENGASLPPDTVRYLEEGLEAVFEKGLKTGMAKLAKYRKGIPAGETPPDELFVEDVVAYYLRSRPDLIKADTERQRGLVEYAGGEHVISFGQNNYCNAVFGGQDYLTIATPFSSEWSGEYVALVSACLSTPPLYNLGLKLLRKIPSSLIKVSVYEQAAQNFPKDAPDGERLALFEEYRALLLKCDSPLRKWGWDEAGAGAAFSLDRAMKKPADGDFKETHFFAHHSINLARLLMNGRSPEIKEKGLALFRGMPSGGTNRTNPHTCGTGRDIDTESMTYRPSLERVVEIMRVAPSIPPSYMGEMPREALKCLKKEDAGERVSPPIADLFLRLAERLGAHGPSDVLDELISYWDGVLVHAQEASIEKIASANERRFEKERLSRLQSEASLLLPVYRASAKRSEEGMIAQIERVRADNQRRRFGSQLIQKFIRYVSQPEVLERISLPDEVVAVLAREAIDRYIAEIGGEWNLFNFEPLVSSLKGLKVSDDTQDGIFEYFIDRLTVRQRPMLTSGRDVHPREIIDLCKGVAFLMDGGRTPKAQAKLLNLLRDASRAVSTNPKGTDAIGAIEASKYLFEILPGQVTAKPERIRGLVDSQTDERIIAATQALSFYRDGLPEVKKSDEGFDIGRLIGAVESAVQKEAWDMPDETALEVKRAVIAEVLLAMERLQISAEASVYPGLARSHTFVPKNEHEGSLVHHVYVLWQKAVMASDHKKAKTLFDLWGEVDERDGIRGRMAFYLDALTHPQTPLETRRAIFSKIALGPAVSSYVKRAWEDAVEDGDTRKERLVYDLARPQTQFDDSDGKPRYRIPSDVVYAIVLEAHPSIASRILVEQTAYAGDPKKYICRPDDEASLVVFADNASAAKFSYMHGSANDGQDDEKFTERLSRIADTVLLKRKRLKTAVFKRWDRTLERLFKGIEGEIKPRFASYNALIKLNVMGIAFDRFFGNVYRNNWNVVSGLMPFIGSVRDMRSAFEAINEAVHLHAKALDRLLAGGFEMTRHMEGRSPQTQLVATRLFAQLPLGKRHTVLKDMDETDRAGANRLFFQETGQAKAGQILSYWPDVPMEERRDLARFQADAPRSDRNEFVDTIRHELKDADAQTVNHIIANLGAEPIGVGTIADVYESSLPDGTKVAVKVITPSKEAEFKNGVSLIRGLRQSLVLYLGALKGIDQMIEVIDMYLGIVDEELDLQNEAWHGRALGAGAPEGIAIPFYAPEFERPKVVVTELVEGERYDTKNPAHVELARNLLYPFAMRQILNEGLFPLDMQPGNLIVTGAGTMIGILDHGQALFLDEEDRALLRRILDGARDKDAQVLAQSLESAGRGGEDYKPQDLRNSLEGFLSDDMALSRGDPVTRLFAICRENGLTLDLKYRKLGKGLATLTAATTIETGADGEAPSRGYDENERVKVAEAIIRNDAEGAAKIMEGVMERIGEHRIAIGWRNARRALGEFVADVKTRVGEERTDILQKILIETARKKGLAINAEAVMNGKYLPRGE